MPDTTPPPIDLPPERPWPAVTTDELVAAYIGDDRQHANRRPWVVLNMVSSIDGAIAVDGVSGGLGGPADKAVFGTLRGLADVIVVASGTVAAEQYRPPQPRSDMAELRRQRGQSERPVIAVVTRSLDLDLDGALFGEADYRPTVVTVRDAPSDRYEAVAHVADIVEAGMGDIDLSLAFDTLAQRHGPTVLVEGGPTLNALVAQADLFDELCISTGAVLVGGKSGRMVAALGDYEPRAFAVDRVVHAGAMIFARYLRDR